MCLPLHLSRCITPENRCGIFNSGTPELQIPKRFSGVLSLTLRSSVVNILSVSGRLQMRLPLTE